MKKARVQPRPPAVRKVAVFLPNWLGDVVMATPALRALRRHFGPQTEIVGILRPHLAEVLVGTRFLDEQWHFDPRSHNPRARRWTLVRELRRRRFDLALLLTNSFHTALLAWLGGAQQRVGYARDGRSFLLTHPVQTRRDVSGHIEPEPVVRTLLKLTEIVGCGPESPRLELSTTPQDEAAADTAWRNLGLRGDGKAIALNLSGAYGPAKLWPEAYGAELAATICDELGREVLVICGPQEREAARRIATLADRRGVVSLADQPLGIGLTKACLRRCQLLVTTDSGPRHVASAFGVPVVTLFGPTLPIWVDNPSIIAANLHLDLECIGCRARHCPKGHHRCMRDLTPAMVFGEVIRLLEESGRRAA
ncbi:MAG: lipopolysaccharide heptosyltransferase II [Planctomycetota bacterium]